MFKNSFQSGLLSIFYSCGANPLALWEMEVRNGHIKRITDREVNSIVLEIVSTNVATTYITCPKNNINLGIKLPFLVLIVKNLKRYFSFEITILDDKNMRRRFRISNFQSTTKIKPFCTSMPIGLSGGWNQIQFNLSDFTRRAYGTQYIEALRVQVHANVRLRRIYFAERLYTEEELPQEYKLYLPLEKKSKKGKEKKEELAAVSSHAPAGKKSTVVIAAPEAAAEEKLPETPTTEQEAPAIEAAEAAEGKETALEGGEDAPTPSEVGTEPPAVEELGEEAAGKAPPEELQPSEGQPREETPVGETTAASAPGEELPEAEVQAEAPPAEELPAEAPPLEEAPEAIIS